MFDHITLRVPDLAAASSAPTAVLDQLELKQTTSTLSFSVWGNFALTQTDAEHPVAQRVHIAFIAPTPAHVDGFAQAGVVAGFADDGTAGPHPGCAQRLLRGSTTSRRQPRSTRRSALPLDWRSAGKLLTAPHSRSAHQTALSY